MTVEKEIDTKFTLRYSTEYLQENCQGTAVPSYSLVNRSYDGQRVMISNWPDWKRRIKNMQKTTNNYSRTGYEGFVTPGTISWSNESDCVNAGGKKILRGLATRIHSTIPTSLSIPADSSGAYNKALGSFMAQVKAANTHISGPTFLGELNKTLTMIRSPAKGISRGVHSLLGKYDSYARRARRRRVREDIMNKDLNDIYLEYAFGWTPLVMETIKGAEALSRLLNEERRIFSVRGFAADKSTAIVPTSRIVIGPSVCAAEIRNTTNASHLIKGGVKAKAKGPIPRGFDLFGFTSNEFVPTVWNLLPFSWLTDYFSNVGDIISATYTDVSGLYWVSHSTQRYYLREAYGFSAVPDSDYKGQVSGSLGAWSLSRKTFQRFSSLTGGYVPDLITTVPGEPYQFLNMVSIGIKAKGISTSLNSAVRRS